MDCSLDQQPELMSYRDDGREEKKSRSDNKRGREKRESCFYFRVKSLIFY